MEMMMTEQCPSWCTLTADEHGGHFDGRERHAGRTIPFGPDADSGEVVAYLHSTDGEEPVLRLMDGGMEYSYDAEELRLLWDLFHDQGDAVKLVHVVAEGQ